MPLIPLALCQLLYGHTSYILPDMMCAGDLKNVKTVCEVHSTMGMGNQAHGFHGFICLELSGAPVLSGWAAPEGLVPAGLRAHCHTARGWAGP